MRLSNYLSAKSKRGQSTYNISAKKRICENFVDKTAIK